jgi:PAS domain S-box-containing protein
MRIFRSSLVLCEVRCRLSARVLLIVATMTVGLPGTNPASAATPKRVLIVHSFARAAPPFTTYSTAFEKELTDKLGKTVDLDEVSLDVARYATLDMEQALVGLMRARQAKWQPDLVVPIGSPAGNFVARHRDRLFPPATPIIYAGIDKRRVPASAFEQNATFVGQSYYIPGWVEDILEIAPETKNIAVVIGASPLEQIWTEVLRSEFRQFENRVNFIWLNDLSLDEILRRTSSLPPHSFIFLLLMMRDASGVTHNGDEVLQKIHAVANAPINGIYKQQLGFGIVGGRLEDTQAAAVDAAGVAVRILQGEPASSFPPKVSRSLPPQYDWRELQRWNIDEKTLPPGSTVLYRAPSAWQQYRGWIIGGASVVIVEGLLIFALVVNALRRRRAERSLSKSEEQVMLAAKAARLGVWELNTLTGEIWASDKARELFEFDAKTSLNRAIVSARVHPEDRAMREATIDRAIEEQGEYDIEYRIQLKDGGIRWISGRARCMANESGKPTRLVGVSRDITERKEAIASRERVAEEARLQREQIELLGRASLLGEMTASLAHELSQPLSAILNYASAGGRFIEGGEPNPGTLQEIFSDIGTAGRRARDIIQNVRNAIKSGAALRGRIAINKVVENVALMVRPDAAAFSCEVQTSLAENLPTVEADPVQMQQVLINLVSNAFHAMRETPIARRKVEITTQLNGNESVRVIVRDHGTGISDEIRERLFEHFYTTKKDGLGMGLAIVRSIVEAHGGKITAGNAEGGGACFEFELPASAKPHV